MLTMCLCLLAVRAPCRPGSCHGNRQLAVEPGVALQPHAVQCCGGAHGCGSRLQQAGSGRGQGQDPSRCAGPPAVAAVCVAWVGAAPPAVLLLVHTVSVLQPWLWFALLSLALSCLTTTMSHLPVSCVLTLAALLVPARLTAAHTCRQSSGSSLACTPQGSSTATGGVLQRPALPPAPRACGAAGQLLQHSSWAGF